MEDTAMIQCKQCGWCCKNIVINVCYSDIVRWFNLGRYDILSEISFIDNYPKRGEGGFYITKTALNPKQQCPFLDKKDSKYVCNIHNIKPLGCKDAPYGYKNNKLEGCPIFDEVMHTTPNSIRDNIIKNQRKDFYLAHINRKSLIDILIQSRMELNTHANINT